jgi:hypothetical protein
MRPEFAALFVIAGAFPAGAFPLAAQPRPAAVPSGPELRLDRPVDPAALERRLRELAGRDPLALTVAGGVARVGPFGVGTLDSLAGDLVVIRGTADIHGRVEGSVVTLDGDIVVHPGGHIAGDAFALGGRIRNAGAIGGAARATVRPLALPSPGAALRLSLVDRTLGLAGVALVLLTLGFGLVTFARPALETVSDTVTHSLGRSFVVGLLAQIVAGPALGLLVLGLALTVVGMVLVPFVVGAGLVVLLTLAVVGLLAAAHAMGETWSRRRLALGAAFSANSYRYLATGLVGLGALWASWVLFGGVPVAGGVVLGGVALATWILLTTGLGATILSRVGARPEFAGRLLPPEALTDEYLWATPHLGVPAGKREER